MAFTIPDLVPPSERATLATELERQSALLKSTRLDLIADQISQISFTGEEIFVTDGCIHFPGKYSDDKSDRLVRRLAQDLIPWRKGPFMVGDLLIDAEWRSDKKWNRLEGALPNLTGQVIADVGCNNGYYLYRTADAGASRVIGFDPTLKYWLQFRLVEAHTHKLPVEFLPLGWQYLNAFPKTFDTIFLMGVNYHEAEPLNLFHACRAALKPGGLLICESVVVQDEADLEIYPAGKYFGIGGVYAIPTTVALKRQLASVGFQNVTIQHTELMTAAEQRSTEYSPQKSLADFVTADGFSTEGYPPLHRSALFAHAAF